MVVVWSLPPKRYATRILKNEKRLAEGFRLAKGGMIRRRGIASLYGLLQAFCRVFILRSVIAKIMGFHLYVMRNCKIESRYDSTILKHFDTGIHK